MSSSVSDSACSKKTNEYAGIIPNEKIRVTNVIAKNGKSAFENNLMNVLFSSYL